MLSPLDRRTCVRAITILIRFGLLLLWTVVIAKFTKCVNKLILIGLSHMSALSPRSCYGKQEMLRHAAFLAAAVGRVSQHLRCRRPPRSGSAPLPAPVQSEAGELSRVLTPLANGVTIFILFTSVNQLVTNRERSFSVKMRGEGWSRVACELSSATSSAKVTSHLSSR